MGTDGRVMLIGYEEQKICAAIIALRLISLSRDDDRYGTAIFLQLPSNQKRSPALEDTITCISTICS